MTHSTTYPFRRWYRRPLTPRESAVIGLLERRRRRTGRVSIVLTVSAAEHAAISRLLLHYALFLNNRCTLSCTLLVATTSVTPHFTLLTSHCAERQQVLGEDVSVVNPMISSALPRCVHGVGIPHRYGKLGELASVKSSTSPGVLTSIISVCYFCDLCIFVSITPDIIKNFCPSVSLQACKSSPRRGRVCR